MRGAERSIRLLACGVGAAIALVVSATSASAGEPTSINEVMRIPTGLGDCPAHSCGNGICEFCEGPQGPAACAEDCAQDPSDSENTCGQIQDPSGTGWVHPDGLTPIWVTTGPYGTGFTCCDDGYCTMDESLLGESCVDCRSYHCGNLVCEEETECSTGQSPTVLCSADCSVEDCTPGIAPVCGNGVCEGHWGWSEVCGNPDPGTGIACPEDCGGVWIPDPFDASQTGGDDPEIGEDNPFIELSTSGMGSWSCENGLHCGDGTCEVSEQFLCDEDCASEGYQVCNNNGTCERNTSGFPGQRDENGINCPQDCLPIGYTCGDGTCSLTEALDFLDDLPEGFSFPPGTCESGAPCEDERDCAPGVCTPPAAGISCYTSERCDGVATGSICLGAETCTGMQCPPGPLAADCGFLVPAAPDPVASYLQLCGDPNNPTVNGLGLRCDTLLCTLRKDAYYLRHTQYNVAYSLGLGEHQGLAVQPLYEYWDVRKLADGAGPKRCASSLSPHEFIHNHGRTIHKTHKRVVAKQQYWVIEYFRRLYLNSVSRLVSTALRTCTRLPTTYDGACDSICGNDGYCLPNGALAQDDADIACMGFTPKDGKSVTGAAVFKGRCDRATRWGWFAWAPFVYSPRFGHNSNNDAEMTLQMFKKCETIATKWHNPGPAPALWSEAEMAQWLGGSGGGVGATDPTKGQQEFCDTYCDGNPTNLGFAKNYKTDGNDAKPPPEQTNKPPCNTGGAAEDSQANIATAKWPVCDGCMNRNEETAADGNPNIQPTAACVITGGCPSCGFPAGKKVKGM